MEPVKVKQEPNTDDSYSCPSSSVKTERSKDGRSACMVGTQIPCVVLRGGNFRVDNDVTAPSVIMRPPPLRLCKGEKFRHSFGLALAHSARHNVNR